MKKPDSRYELETLQLLQHMSTAMYGTLSAALGAAEELGKQLEAAGKQDQLMYFSMLQKNNYRLLNIADNMNALSNIELEEQVLDYSIIELNEMLEELVDTVHCLKPAAELRYIGAAPCSIKADGKLLERMFLNIISNSFLHSKECVIRAEPDGSNQFCTLRFRDNGSGLLPGQDPFGFPSSMAELLQPGRGAGLGLKTAESIARLHGGKMLVSSHPEGGTEVTVRLPLAGPQDVKLYRDGYVQEMKQILTALADVTPRECFLSPYL